MLSFKQYTLREMSVLKLEADDDFTLYAGPITFYVNPDHSELQKLLS